MTKPIEEMDDAELREHIASLTSENQRLQQEAAAARASSSSNTPTKDPEQAWEEARPTVDRFKERVARGVGPERARHQAIGDLLAPPVEGGEGEGAA